MVDGKRPRAIVVAKSSLWEEKIRFVTQRPGKKKSWFSVCFWGHFFDFFWSAKLTGDIFKVFYFFTLLEPFFGRFWEPKSSKTAPKTDSKKNKNRKHEIAPPLNENLCFLGHTWSQNGPNVKPNVCLEASENDVRKIIKKCLQKRSQKGPKWEQIGPNRAQKAVQFEAFSGVGSQGGAKWAPEGPKGPKLGPKGGPNGPQRVPK